MLIPARTGGAPLTRSASLPFATSIPAEVWILGALTLLGALLRFAMLGTQSYWVDEAQAANELHLSLGAMLHTIGRAEPNPPGYFVIAWVWAKLFGTSEAGLRSLSALAGTALIPVSYLCGRELISRRAGIGAGALVCLSPFMIWYSQEAREYMLLALVCAGSLLAFVRASRAGSQRALLFWSVLSALALLTHYFAVFIVVPEALWLLWLVRRPGAARRASVIAVLGVGIVGLALMSHFLAHAAHPREWIGAFPLSIRIRQVPTEFGVSALYRSSAVDLGLIGAGVVAAALIALLVTGATTAELRGAGLAAALCACVVLVPLGLAALGRDYYIARALIAGWVPLALLVGAACTLPLDRGRGLWLAGRALALALVLMFAYTQIRIDTHASYQRPDWRGVASALGPQVRVRAIVAYDGAFAQAPLTFYLPGVRLASAAPRAPVSELDVIGSNWQSSPARLPGGVRLLSSRAVDGYLVKRFALPGPLALTSAQLAARAGTLLGPATAGPSVLVQG